MLAHFQWYLVIFPSLSKNVVGVDPPLAKLSGSALVDKQKEVTIVAEPFVCQLNFP